ncbi:DUF1294 domain-containing protein [Massilia endophytica]|uniref:DUF1294 domain-containing protein n=1 Tax=Massilia endophytica TaxID=2899220 RepID=UPI001E5299CF|nr:DUF1294 domain-containing protein [Massilia endophytica]UGQ48293.1 DUF1294 domain-containing protein [Massilia endophytica]
MTPAALLAGVYGLASVICFFAYAIDKSAARKGRRRTPERTLLLIGLACGWPGGFLAQQWLRHKSSKPSFLIKFWLTAACNIALLAALLHSQSAGVGLGRFLVAPQG